MQPVQITMKDLPSSPALEDHIRKRAQKLSQFYQRINNCRVVITIPQKHKRQGKLYCVRIDLTVPGKELVVNRKLDEDVYIAIRDAFNALERQLDSFVHKQRGEVKTHEFVSRGQIARLLFDEDYGFIQGTEGDEYYFSAVNVANPKFNQLKVGDVVEFIAITGSDGLQANRVTIVKHNNVDNNFAE